MTSNLFLNDHNTKIILFSGWKKKKKIKAFRPAINQHRGSVQIELVSHYRYLLIDYSCFYTTHSAPCKKLEVKLGSYFRIKPCLSFEVKKKVVAATLLSVLDYGDALYMHFIHLPPLQAWMFWMPCIRALCSSSLILNKSLITTCSILM